MKAHCLPLDSTLQCSLPGCIFEDTNKDMPYVILSEYFCLSSENLVQTVK